MCCATFLCRSARRASARRRSRRRVTARTVRWSRAMGRAWPTAPAPRMWAMRSTTRISSWVPKIRRSKTNPSSRSAIRTRRTRALKCSRTSRAPWKTFLRMSKRMPTMTRRTATMRTGLTTSWARRGRTPRSSMRSFGTRKRTSAPIRKMRSMRRARLRRQASRSLSTAARTTRTPMTTPTRKARIRVRTRRKTSRRTLTWTNSRLAKRRATRPTQMALALSSPTASTSSRRKKWICLKTCSSMATKPGKTMVTMPRMVMTRQVTAARRMGKPARTTAARRVTVATISRRTQQRLTARRRRRRLTERTKRTSRPSLPLMRPTRRMGRTSSQKVMKAATTRVKLAVRTRTSLSLKAKTMATE
mmetsp:Transcript_6455/g.26210  ORF Transcript_6455/g.26210 Transcript_6455/m.26210 type:complete len:361 (-) Transcript_6455:2023-3105(-)